MTKNTGRKENPNAPYTYTKHIKLMAYVYSSTSLQLMQAVF